MLKLEIFYYKFLGWLFCVCPFRRLKTFILDYANNRFPLEN